MDSVIHNGLSSNDTSKIGQDQQQALATLPFCYDDAIAVVGYACRFAGAENSHAFWQNLVSGRECGLRSSCAELLATGADAPIIDTSNFINLGTAIPDADNFDAALFGYTASDAATLNPQQRLFLQIAWHALEHAGFAPTDVPHKTGVFTSAQEVRSLPPEDRDHVAPQVARKLNLRGPAVSLQTTCCSSLVAVHLACESLRSGESDMAIAGGVDISFPQVGDELHLPGTLYSPNGAAAIVLRRLADALDDGDPVLAVLPSSAMNNDGAQRAGHAALSVAGQREVISMALAQAGIDSTKIGLIEAHGALTPRGDPIELQALCTVFHTADAGPPCALGSVKGNLGFLDSAAGIAGMLKTIMAVEHGVIPPSLHFEQDNTSQQMADSPFYVPTQAHSWNDATRIAGISAFNIGGTNCHVLASSLPPALRQAMTGSRPFPAVSRTTPKSSAAVLLLSTASETALRQLAAAYALALEKTSSHDLAYTALHGRQLDLPYRLALSLTTVEDATAALAGYAGAHPEPLLYRGHGDPGKLVWVCSGEGTQWVGMGQSLYRQSMSFAQTLERCFDACGKECANQLRKAIFGFSGEQLAQPILAQPVIIAFQIAMAAHWRALGLEPEMVLGQGIGEYAAAVIAGHFSIEQIMPVVCTRARLLQDWQAVPHYVASQAAAAVPDDCATARFHEVTAILSKVCANLHAVPSSVRMISSVTGAVVSADQLNADAGEHWCRHLQEPDCLGTALQAASSAGATVFLELGADASLSSMAHQCMWPVLANPDSQACWIASARRQQVASVQLEQALLQLYVAGFDLRWQEILPSSGRKVQAPLYVFDTNTANATDATNATDTMTSLALDTSVVTTRHLQPANSSVERRCSS
ncbi:acyl transferase domain-containing protein [Herbaspirillum sp. Sphag1AN]|uniref:type I polyketide synthase n=1 Tax=unclassified Herbaspirillum TaxID=2624150 RepID=UPI00161D0C8E|nr:MULTISPECIES: type I polyketide synthase [unclassified Herbaspirillum]MBB3212925.1 acyl transferase domain-containing protein [Herbaspirillum sp. Sphag1AN]MBB3246122.1 acyl transferase domain-containing protein [Herbaspirillum sp. Sphag64]